MNNAQLIVAYPFDKPLLTSELSNSRSSWNCWHKTLTCTERKFIPSLNAPFNKIARIVIK